jgi:phospholipid/cholesterol/gamma-HCH transport system substrate-binding protein
MNEQALRFRVGVFVLSSFILLAVLVTLFGGMPGVFRRQVEYTIIFNGREVNVAGVGPGTPVRKSGVPIGEVKDVRLDNETGEVKIRIGVNGADIIRENDQPMLNRGLLGGDTSIEFTPQSQEPAPENQEAKEEKEPEQPGAAEECQPPANPPPPAPLPPGAQIRGVQQGDANRLISDISRLMPAVERTLKSLDRMTPELERTIRQYRLLATDSRDLIPAIRKTNDELLLASVYWRRVGERLDVLIQTNQDKIVRSIDGFNDLLVRLSNMASEENQKNLNATLKNLRAGTENLDSIGKNTDGFLKEGRQTLKRVNDSIGQADEVLNNLNRATKPMADRSAAIMHNLDEATDRLNRLLQMFQGSGSLQLLLSDPSLYNNLNEAACMIKRMMPTIDRALQDLELFADKLARHPESIGLGGMINPSSGLKR